MAAPIPSDLPQSYLEENIGYKLKALCAASIPFLTLFVALRVYCRRLTKAPWWFDDYLVLWAYFMIMANSAFYIWSVLHAGVGQHFAALELISPETVVTYWRFLLTASFLYFFTVPWPKLALLALYYRLFGSKGTGKVNRWILLILAIVTLTTCIVTTVWTMNLCKPFAANWDRSLLTTEPGAYCVQQQDFYLFGSLPNIITDIVMLILPMPVVWKLNLNRKNKVALTAIFLLGSLGLATSILRFTFFIGTSAVEDGSYNSVQLSIWTTVEMSVYLITACLPVYRPLLRKLLGVSASEVQGQFNKPGANFPAIRHDPNMVTYSELESGKNSAKSTKSKTNAEDDVQLLDYPHATRSGLRKYGNIEVRKDITVQRSAV